MSEENGVALGPSSQKEGTKAVIADKESAKVPTAKSTAKKSAPKSSPKKTSPKKESPKSKTEDSEKKPAKPKEKSEAKATKAVPKSTAKKSAPKSSPKKTTVMSKATAEKTAADQKKTEVKKPAKPKASSASKARPKAAEKTAAAGLKASTKEENKVSEKTAPSPQARKEDKDISLQSTATAESAKKENVEKKSDAIKDTRAESATEAKAEKESEITKEIKEENKGTSRPDSLKEKVPAPQDQRADSKNQSKPADKLEAKIEEKRDPKNKAATIEQKSAQHNKSQHSAKNQQNQQNQNRNAPKSPQQPNAQQASSQQKSQPSAPAQSKQQDNKASTAAPAQSRQQNQNRNAPKNAQQPSAQQKSLPSAQQKSLPSAQQKSQPNAQQAKQKDNRQLDNKTNTPAPAQSRQQNAPKNAQQPNAQQPNAQQAKQQDNKQQDNKASAPKSSTPETVESSNIQTPRKKMFVSVQSEEQVEVVITEEGQVQEYYVEMLQQAKTKGNIYKGTIHNLDANLQAAFINYGANRNGFLQIDEVHPEYYNVSMDDNKGRRYPPIQKALKAGQEILVQVVKEPTGTKGAFLTSYISLPGRFLVLTPGREQIGISRKVDNDEERGRLRNLLEGLNPGAGLGVIVRTVSDGATKATLRRDLQSLKRSWMEVRKLGTSEKAPALIYEEMALTIRAVRDYLTDQISEIWLDHNETADEVEKMVKNLFPRKNNLTYLHDDPSVSLFERFNLQRQLDQIQSREVTLPSGGRLVIDPTEALTAIDINSGKISGKSNFEDMAFKTNREAAKMIPLQLRLRDIGGQVVCDFIEMKERAHWREVERTIKVNMKGDRARYDVGKISQFGMLEIVRQRLGSSAISVSMEVCPHCKGAGVRRNIEWQSQQALKEISRQMRTAKENKQETLIYEVEKPLAMHLLNNKRQRLCELEELHELSLEIKVIA